MDFESSCFSGYTKKCTLQACFNNLKQFSEKEIKSERSEAKRTVARYDRLKKMKRCNLDEYFYNLDKIQICDYILENKIEKQRKKLG